jgi:hypothetical protein
LLSLVDLRRFSTHIGIRAPLLEEIAQAPRTAGISSLDQDSFRVLMQVISGFGGSTVAELASLLENENWLWYGPLDRLAASRWLALSATKEVIRLRRLSRGFSVPEPDLAATDALDRAVFDWFSGEPSAALYAAMNEYSVRRFFQRLRREAPSLMREVSESANREAERVGTPVPLPGLVL